MKGTYGELGKYEAHPYDFSRLNADIGTGKFDGLSSKEDLLTVYNLPLNRLIDSARSIRSQRKTAIDYCASSYLPHQNGKGCEMNCNFCGYPEKIYDPESDQGRSKQFVPELTKDAIIEHAKAKKAAGATRYKLVSLGCSIRNDEYEIAIKTLPCLFDEIGFEKVCLSFGVLNKKRIAGLVEKFGTEKIELNHNLEAGNPDAYERLVGNSNVFWHARYNTIKTAKEYGLHVCAGGLVGIGESKEDQADLVLALRSLNVDSSPFNVFVMDEHDKSVVAEKIRKKEIKRPSDEELLRTLCMWRLGLPKSSIAVNSGFGSSGNGDFGAYSELVENALINDKVSLPNQGVLSKRRYT